MLNSGCCIDVWMNVNFARIYVLTVVPLKIILFWGLTPYSLVAPCQCSGVDEYFSETFIRRWPTTRRHIPQDNIFQNVDKFTPELLQLKICLNVWRYVRMKSKLIKLFPSLLRCTLSLWTYSINYVNRYSSSVGRTAARVSTHDICYNGLRRVAKRAGKICCRATSL